MSEREITLDAEGVEAAAEAAWKYDTEGINHEWADELSQMKVAYREQARAAVTAYLEATGGDLG